MAKTNYRRMFQTFYEKKYYNMFNSLYPIVGLEQETNDYIMDSLLTKGRLSAWKLDELLGDDAVGYSQYVEKSRNMYGKPIDIQRLIVAQSTKIDNLDKTYTNHKDIAIINLGFVPKELIDAIITQIVEIEMTIKTNINLAKMPFILTSTSGKDRRGLDDLLDNKDIIEMESGVEVAATGAPYIIDKLYRYRTEKEHELFTLFGVDNVKFEKGAQMNNDEINANNSEVSQFGSMIQNKLQMWIDEQNELFGTSLSIKSPEVNEAEPEGQNISDEGGGQDV